MTRHSEKIFQISSDTVVTQLKNYFSLVVVKNIFEEGMEDVLVSDAIKTDADDKDLEMLESKIKRDTLHNLL